MNAFRRHGRLPVVDKVAVVTGAGSGIGRALALELARRGAHLALCDVDQKTLTETARLLDARGTVVHLGHLDMGDREAVIQYADTVAAHFGVVHQVYNNAGVTGGGRTVLDQAWEVFDRTLRINLFGVIHGTKAFLPHLIASGNGHVVNVSSLNGYLAQPGLSAYVASKFGVRGFTETVRTEMLAAGHPVRVTSVHPGGVKTNIANATLEHARSMGLEPTKAETAQARVYNEKLLRMFPGQAARIIVDGVERGDSRIRVGRDAVITDLLVRAAPELYPRLVARLQRAVFRARQNSETR